MKPPAFEYYAPTNVAETLSVLHEQFSMRHGDFALVVAAAQVKLGTDASLQMPLASNVVRYVGEPVAIIVANSRYAELRS